MNRAWPLRRVLKYSAVGGGIVLTGLSLRTNDYDINSVGIIRLSRAALTVYDIACLYRNNLYKKQWDKTSAEYKAEKSRSHLLAAEKLLELICINKGVYIKVGQHIGSLDYLLPAEYVSTMKVLHSNAPKNPVEDLYKVIRQDLKVNVSIAFSIIFGGSLKNEMVFLFFSPKICLRHLMRSHLERHRWLKCTVPHWKMVKKWLSKYNIRMCWATAKSIWKQWNICAKSCQLSSPILKCNGCLKNPKRIYLSNWTSWMKDAMLKR